MRKKSVEICLLGRFQVRVAGTRLGSDDLPGRKAPALLKLLALGRDHQVVRDQVMGLLWPDLDSAGAAAQLYKAIHQLRKAFGAGEPDSAAEEWIVTGKDVLRLAPPGGLATDVDGFERMARDALATRHIRELERTAALYAGDLLPMDLYAGWTQAPRDRLRQLYVDVLLALGQGYQARGELAAAAEVHRTALEKDPTLETAHRGLMTIFARQGQRDRALKQYGLCLDALAEDLGVAPSAETRALYDEIERQQPIAAPAVDRTPVPAPLRVPPLVNREAECRVIDACLAGLLAGRGRALLIEGPAGIGKTRLVRELVARARGRGFQALIGSACEMEGRIAYGPFLDILRTALRDSRVGQEHLPAEIAGALHAHPQDGQSVPNSDPRAAQTYLFAGIVEFLRQRALSVPLVVALENGHAADQGSLELFHFLARRSQDVPLLLVATWRTEGSATGTPLDKLAQGIRQTATLEVLALGPLSTLDHHELLLQHGGDPSLPRERSDEIFRLSEGNPMYALELHEFRARSAAPQTAAPPPAGTIPPSLRSSVAERLEKLSAPARELLTVAAVAGEGVSYPLLEALWSGSNGSREGADGNLLDVLDQLIAAQLLDERGVQFHFRHALYRDSIYESVSAARRRVIHAQVAHCLVELGEREGELPVEQIALHYQRAGEARQAAHFLTLAGQRAASMYAHDDTLRRYRDALALLEPAKDAMVRRICADLHGLIGDTCRAAGYLGQSFAAYERATALMTDLPVSAAALTELHRKTALVAIFATDLQKAAHHLAEAWRLAGDDPRVHAQLHILRALHLWHFNRLEEAAAYAHRALELAEGAQATVEAAQACEILAMAYLPLGRWQEGLRYEKQRLHHGRWSPDLVVATDAHLCLWEYHVHDDHMLEGATVFMRDVAAEADRLGDLRCVAICQYALGTIHLWQGDSTAALQHLDQSLLLHDKVGSPAGMAYALARQAAVHTLANALEPGWQSVQQGIEQAQRAAIRDHCLQRLYGVGIWNRLQAADTGQVVELVARSEALLAANGPCTACSLDLYPWLALHYLQGGDLPRAAVCAERLEQLAAKTGSPVGETCAAIVRAGVERARGDTGGHRLARQQALQLMQGPLAKGGHSPLRFLFDRLAGPH